MSPDPRIVQAVQADEDAQYEQGLHPRTLDDYIGQERVRANLQVSIAAARQRHEALDHVLLYGPAGLGKTTLAYVIGNELGVAVKATSGPVLERRGTLRRSSPAWVSTRSCSSTRFTGCRRRSRKSCTRRWKTTSWTS